MISPLDGRYSSRLSHIEKAFSDHTLAKYRVDIEVRYLISLCNTLNINVPCTRFLLDLSKSETLLEDIRHMEHKTNHDIKAVIEYIRQSYITHIQKDDNIDMATAKIAIGYLHFGLTSEDIVSSSINAAFREYVDSSLANSLLGITGVITRTMKRMDGYIVPARTHGQPAVPMSMDSAFRSHLHRVAAAINPILDGLGEPYPCKFSGSIGNFIVHRNVLGLTTEQATCLVDDVLKEYGLVSAPPAMVTQVDNHGTICANLQTMINTSRILYDMCRDIWHYQSLSYVVFKKPISETGSSTMSQKTNPIGIENAMSNFELFDTMASHMVKEFSRSIMQRDLTSSSLLRNLASVLAYFDIACHNMQKDMFQLFPGEYVMDNMYHLLAEHVQCTLKHICGIYDADELVRNHFKGLLNMTQGQYSLAIINILNESGVSAGDKIATASALAVDINNVW